MRCPSTLLDRGFFAALALALWMASPIAYLRGIGFRPTLPSTVPLSRLPPSVVMMPSWASSLAWSLSSWSLSSPSSALNLLRFATHVYDFGQMQHRFNPTKLTPYPFQFVLMSRLAPWSAGCDCKFAAAIG